MTVFHRPPKPKWYMRCTNCGEISPNPVHTTRFGGVVHLRLSGKHWKPCGEVECLRDKTAQETVEGAYR